MRGPSGKTWSPRTASPAATKACSASCASGAERKRPKLASSSSPRCAGPLRRGRHAVPHSRSRPQRQSRIRRRPCAENTAEGAPFRKSGRSPSLPGSLGATLGRRIHGTTKRQVAAMFAEEKPTLLPLPLEPFRYYQYGERIVHLDGCVEVEAAYYGAPPRWIGRVLRVQWDEVYVRLLDPKTGQLLREHVRQKRGWYRIKEEDHPKRTPLRTSQLLWRAGRAGRHIGALCNAIHRA